MRRGIWTSSGLALVAAALALALAGGATARSTSCSASGDVCVGAIGQGSHVRLAITLQAKYFSRYTLCVRGPDGHSDCGTFRIVALGHGTYGSSVSWAKRFPFRGAGRYYARWNWGSGPSARIDFAEGPSIHVNPNRVRAGRVVRLYGLSGGCGTGSTVTLYSSAFPHTHEFAGVPAVFARVAPQDTYSVKVRIPRGRRPALYHVGARCGGASFGVASRLRVLRP